MPLNRMVKPTIGICCEFAQKSCEKLKVFVQKVETKKLFKKGLKFLKSCDIIFGVKGKRLDEKKTLQQMHRMEEHHEQQYFYGSESTAGWN